MPDNINDLYRLRYSEMKGYSERDHVVSALLEIVRELSEIRMFLNDIAESMERKEDE